MVNVCYILVKDYLVVFFYMCYVDDMINMYVLYVVFFVFKLFQPCVYGFEPYLTLQSLLYFSVLIPNNKSLNFYISKYFFCYEVI